MQARDAFLAALAESLLADRLEIVLERLVCGQRHVGDPLEGLAAEHPLDFAVVEMGK